MITPILERLLLQGDANFTVWNHSLGMFGRIPAQDGKVTVITKIIWYPFVDYPENALGGTMTWLDFMRSNEYQLKIESGKNVTYYPIRNSISLTNASPFTVAVDLQNLINGSDYSGIVIELGDPLIIDTFILASGEIKLTISRNPFTTFVNNTGLLAGQATEKPAPNGVANIPLLRRSQQLASGGANQFYNPPSNEYSGVASGGARNQENYILDIVPQSGAVLNSQLNYPDGGGAATATPIITKNLPLVSFHCVFINKEAADKIQSTK
jgi:hypothetical protein